MKQNKFFKVVLSFPFLLSAAVVVPISLSVLSYALSPNNRFHNDEKFHGHILEGDPSTFKFEKINRLFKIENHSSWNNYQGGAFYNQYYCLAANNFENLLIYDMANYKIDEVILDCGVDTSYHCNTIAFGTDFYSKKDKYPLLYISMENPDVHCTNVYRLIRKSNRYVTSKVQEIIFPSAKECGVYLPNSYIDHNNVIEQDGLALHQAYLYYSGYTQNSYKKSDDNKLRYFRFPLPKAANEDQDYDFTIKLKDQVLSQIEKGLYHDVPSETATQGGFIANGYLYQTFAFHDNPIMRILNLRDFSLTYSEEIGKYGVFDEYENIGTYNNRIFAFGIKKLSIFEFKFEMTIPNNE